MFTRRDYLILRGFERAEARSIRGIEPGPSVRAAERKLMDHVRAGLPRPEDVPAYWWDYAVAIARAQIEWEERYGMI